MTTSWGVAMAGPSKSWLAMTVSLGLLALPGCVGASDGQAATEENGAAVVTIAPQPLRTTESAAPPRAESFADFIDGVRADALAAGVKPATLDAALAGVTHIDRVIELDRKQPEFSLSFSTYLDRIVTPARVAEGKRKLEENRDLLAAIERRYGVQPRFIVALWGIETGFGRNTGGMSVVSSLATLAYDGRRSAYFRTELMQALTILDQGHIAPSAMVGSWAGAMGQCQFMPSTFVKFAVDWDGDGRRDIWRNQGDALASAANYLSSEGWIGDQTWGRAVDVPEGLSAELTGVDKTRTLAEWSRLGIHAADGKPLPQRDIRASLIRAEQGKGQPFLVYDNFRTIMKWNRSTFFALAVGHLADRIGDR
ncbi:lytic murein transglycosylase [Magnetospirillum molischianum]|uniref:lytic murein transglycosylase n=1 Tax=Magnetospirillum molischianum TaxID=1083 RepID=UPI001F447219|nr:lytic murein transglycosylase [Magnetospirillum molischianum]